MTDPALLDAPDNPVRPRPPKTWARKVEAFEQSFPDPGPPDPPDPETLNITAFAAEVDPTCTVDDLLDLQDGDTVTLTATAGDADAQALINGHSAAIYARDETAKTFKVSSLDLSAADVTGLTATASFQPPLDTTGTITAFTAALPTEVTMDAEDEALLEVGNTIKLTALTGDPAAMAAIDGNSVPVVSLAPVTLLLDLEGVTVDGLTADFEIQYDQG